MNTLDHKQVYAIQSRLAEIPKTKQEYIAEIAGKESVLFGAYLEVSEGHPHCFQKMFIEKELIKDKEMIVNLDAELVHFKKILYDSSISVGARS